MGHLVLAVAVEAGGQEDHLRPVRIQRGHDRGGEDLAIGAARSAGRQRDIHDMCTGGVGTAVGIEGVLEGGDEEHPRIVSEDLLRAIAVMYVEVDDGQPCEAMRLQGRGPPHWRRC